MNITLTVAAIVIGTLLGICMTVERSLQTEMEVIRSGQQEIQKDLVEVKTLLNQRRGDSNLVAQAIPTPQQALPPAPQPGLPSGSKISLDNALGEGDENIKVALVEFTDFQCPFCKALFAQTMPQLVTDYVRTGKLRYIVKDIPLESMHSNAVKAAEAVHCANVQGKGWDMRARLFQNQDQLAPEALIAHARALGLNEAAFAPCLNNGEYSATVRKSMAEGQATGVTGTPTLFLGVVDPETKTVTTIRSIVGAQPISVFQTAIADVLSAKK
jgi:protein-disulfide isomerase